MAKSKTALGVDLVGEEARLVLLEVGETGERVISVQKVAAGTLARTFRAFQRRPSTVVGAVSLEQSAIRTLNLPPTSEENMERVVALEAESAVPFQAEDLAIAYQNLGMTDQSRIEVLLAASRQSVLHDVLQTLNCAPWVSASATVSSIALFNALQKQRDGNREAACAILRVEAERSEMLVLDRKGIVVAQVVPIGCGAGVSAPQPQPVTVGGGGEALSGLGTSEPAWVATIAQNVRYALHALSYERGLTVDRLYVCGEGAGRPQVDWQLSERLDIPVTLLQDLGGDGAAWGPEFAVAYGCALQAAGRAQAALSLSIPRVTVAREVEQRRQARMSWWALAAAVLVAAGLVFWAALHNKELALERAQVKLHEVERIRVPKPPMPPQELTNAAKAVDDALKTRVSGAAAITALNHALPQGTWLAELTYNAQTGAVLRGYSTDQDGPLRAQIALLGQHLFDEVTLDYRNEDHIGERKVWGFQVTCRLKQPEKGRR